MDNSHFVNFFGESPLVRVLDFLLENKPFDYTKTDIAKGAGISRVSLYKCWPAFTEHGIVRPTRRIGSTQLYALNAKSAVVLQLLELDLRLSRAFAERASHKAARKAAR